MTLAPSIAMDNRLPEGILDPARHPPSACVQTTSYEGERFRAVHKRCFSAQKEEGSFVARDLLVIGPWRRDKQTAKIDKATLVDRFSQQRDAGLFRALHEISPIRRESHGYELFSWEIEIESRSCGTRRARAVIRGDRPAGQCLPRFTVQGEWQKGKTAAENYLHMMLDDFADDPRFLIKPCCNKRNSCSRGGPYSPSSV